MRSLQRRKGTARRRQKLIRMTAGGTFDEWKRANADVAKDLVFTVKQNDGFDNQRREVHAKMLSSLKKLLSSVRDKKKQIEDDLKLFSGHELPDVEHLAYDDKSVIMRFRIAAAIAIKIRKKQIELSTKKFGFLLDFEHDIELLINLFRTNLIPENLLCLVPQHFFEKTYRDLIEPDLRKLNYYLAYHRRLKNELRTCETALWARDLPAFVRQLVNQAKIHYVPENSYFYPLDGEIGLSRCFFCYKSPHIVDIDGVVDSILEMKPREFTDLVLDKCYRLMFFRDSMDATDQSLALLLFFRCIFNRCYEKYPSFFAPKTLEIVNKIGVVSDYPAKQFLLPHKMLGVEVKDQSIGFIFRNNQFYRNASMFLENSLFMCNPIDALYYIHKTLTGIHKGALISRMDGAAANVADIKRLLCFDDLFALLFGCLMATGPPVIDVFYLCWFIENYAPKSLSPSFEYAQTNLVALAVHCRKLDFEKLENGEVIYPDT